MPDIFTTAQVATLLQVPTWQVQRLFSDGSLPEVSRFAGKRAIPGVMLPAIVDALRDRGWLPASAEAVSR